MCTNPSEKYCKYCGNTIVFAVFQFFSVFGNSCFLLVLSFLPFFFVLAASFKFRKFCLLFCSINLLLKFDTFNFSFSPCCFYRLVNFHFTLQCLFIHVLFRIIVVIIASARRI